jgi:hypothetical protein
MAVHAYYLYRDSTVILYLSCTRCWLNYEIYKLTGVSIGISFFFPFFFFPDDLLVGISAVSTIQCVLNGETYGVTVCITYMQTEEDVQRVRGSPSGFPTLHGRFHPP